ncbi:lysophospholipid acyltransferase family protein [Flavobacterium sp. JP2137]|uniref:lysophospholipid acyltransferase family protein n=1 Tax=Flavobacterium sp. JP2137 TaxID=3414510 RepID=UPI003D2FE78A
MQKIISYPLSVLFVVCFLICLLVFHPMQWLCLRLSGYQAHKKSVDYLNFLLLRCTNILGTTYDVKDIALVPEGVPIVFVANHQSMFDIPCIIWNYRKAHPKFVSKKELGRGIPSISYNLRHGGSVLIDRKDSKQALSAIRDLGVYIQKYNRAAVIFPEGTRSRDGQPKRFSENGLKILCKYAPNAVVVPITINNSWKMLRFGKFPLGLGNRIEVITHAPLAIKDYPFDQLFEAIENSIKRAIK